MHPAVLPVQRKVQNDHRQAKFGNPWKLVQTDGMPEAQLRTAGERRTQEHTASEDAQPEQSLGDKLGHQDIQVVDPIRLAVSGAAVKWNHGFEHMADAEGHHAQPADHRRFGNAGENGLPAVTTLTVNSSGQAPPGELLQRAREEVLCGCGMLTP